MNKQQLEQIFTKEYQPALWRNVLTEVFGVTYLYQNPEPITLNSNEIAKTAFELGSFKTNDARIIGIYEVNLNDTPNIERNRVGLRETLRSIYKYDVDGALVVFVQDDKWRLSFISEIRTLDENGEPTKHITEPKRYTYLLGRGEKVKTSAIRLTSIAGKEFVLEDIREAFSVEALNEEFYKIVRDYFYRLVGGKVGKGRSQRTYDRLLKLPIAESKENEKHFREFAVRLIGRTIFCWFLKVKKSDAGIPLLPESLLSKEAVDKNSDYYHSILERLFFQTLNTPMNKRRDDLPEGCEIIPFLNGGLFEPQLDDFYELNSATGINNNLNTLKIPDEWFAEFFEEISHYNFTADENSPVDIEFSIDPEMLGRIFENLLAEIDPDTGESARKATGSFYTPREIVSYMVDESLIYYLKAKLESETKGFGFQTFGETQTNMFGNEGRIQQKFEIPLENNRWQKRPDELEKALRELFSHDTSEHQFNETEREILIRAIDDCKVLDPACGSGAFPIGVLQRLVFLLEKLDTNNEKWKYWQKAKAIRETEKAFEEGDQTQRDARLKEISDAFEKDSSDYGRKLFLIERCIYGVDIQPIAAEISKLRCFLTLVVDDTVDETAENRGVRHLPNLEFKFVTADALLKLPQSSLYNSDAKLEDLARIRSAYLQSYGEKKVSLKDDFKKLQGEILDEQIKASGDMQDERAIKLGGWKPFEHEKTDWFDPLWMFGVKDFDIVIGNPPYVVSKNKIYRKIYQESVYGRPNLYGFFIHASLVNLITDNGFLCFINPKTLLTDAYFSALRKFILKNGSVESVLNIVNRRNVFESVLQSCIVDIFRKTEQNSTVRIKNIQIKQDINLDNYLKISDLDLIFGEKESPLFLVAESKNAYQIMRKIRSFKTLSQSGIKFTTGKIQWDKYSQHLSDVSQENSTRLIWAENMQRYFFAPAKNRADKLFINCPLQSCQPISKDTIVVQRTTAVEQKWRIISTIVSPTNFGFPIQAENNTSYLESNSTNANLKFILSLLNSSLMDYVFRLINSNTHVSAGELNDLPFSLTEKQKTFENLVDYILFLKDSQAPAESRVVDGVADSRLAGEFEEAIDALVYELYFEEDFRHSGVSLLEHAAAIFPAIENLEPAAKLETIADAYRKLKDEAGEFYKNLKLMDERLSELLEPIRK